MARQPFLPNYLDTGFQFGPDVLEHRTAFLALIGRCVVLWPEVEIQMAVVMANLLKANTDGATALYFSLRNAKVRRNALEAVSETVLAGDDLLLFQGMQVFYGSVEAERNDLAHGVFGCSDDDENILVWTTTTDHTHFFVKDVGAKFGEPSWVAPGSRLREAMFVYRAADLERIKSNMQQLHTALHRFNRYLLDPVGNASEFQTLCSQPAIAAAMSRLRDAEAKRKSRQK